MHVQSKAKFLSPPPNLFLYTHSSIIYVHGITLPTCILAASYIYTCLSLSLITIYSL